MVLKKFVRFVAHQAAIGKVFYGVNLENQQDC